MVMLLQPGDIFLTRNFGGEDANPTPGYYNHSAIFAQNNWVVEAQEFFNCIIAVPIWFFLERYPEILVLRNKQIQLAQKTSDIATKYVGRPFMKYISLRPYWLRQKGDNCVSVIRRIYFDITKTDYHWLTPDDFKKPSPLFMQVDLKKDYENYIKPEDLYEGAVTIPPENAPIMKG